MSRIDAGRLLRAGSMDAGQLCRFASEIDPFIPIDLGILRAVQVLRDGGFATFGSCEGGVGHRYAEPTVESTATQPRQLFLTRVADPRG